MRKTIVAGNWKMNLNKAEAVALAKAIAAKVPAAGTVTVGVIPPFVYLDAVGQAIHGSAVHLGAQDAYFEKNGAYTGEISVDQLRDVAASFALVGHSERRHVLGESDALINKKLHALLAGKMGALLCVGETIDQRQANQTFNVVGEQIDKGLAGVVEAQGSHIVIAYEPVWAIGTGLNATPAQAQEVHAFIRERLKKKFSAAFADNMAIQYGGSVKAANAAELMTQADIDGALVGGASLKIEEFLGIITAAAGAKKR